MKKLFFILLISFLGQAKIFGQVKEHNNATYPPKDFYYHNFKGDTIRITDYYTDKKSYNTKMDVFPDLTFHTIYLERNKLKDKIPNPLKSVLVKIHVMSGMTDTGYMDNLNIGKKFNTYLFYIDSDGLKSAYLVNYDYFSIKSVVKIAEELPVLCGNQCPEYKYTTLKSPEEWWYKRQISTAMLPNNLLMINCQPYKSSLIKKFKINDSGYVEVLK